MPYGQSGTGATNITIGSEPVITTDRPIYLDSNILIYAMETDGERGILARRWLMQIDRARVRRVTSALTIVEVLPHPISIRDSVLVNGYRRLLTDRPTLRVLPISLKILFRATELRADFGSETPDAIHVATALIDGCGGFVTNDTRLKLPPTIARYGLSDVMDLYR